MGIDSAQSNNKIERILKFFEGLSPMEILDILHFLRIEFADHYKDFSQQNFKKYQQKFEFLPNLGGVYIILMIDLIGDVILYIGRTSGKSKTSGLKFRIQDHTKLLGKTPLTIFVPNWWIKKIYSIPINDKIKAKKLEEALWNFVLNQVKNNTKFYSLLELEDKILGLLQSYELLDEGIISIELQPHRETRTPFFIKSPPAGQPRYLTYER
jgi:hypothetical protein